MSISALSTSSVVPPAVIESAPQPLPDAAVQARRAATAEHTALTLTLGSLRRFLQDSQITEICINRPGALFIETGSGWHYESAPDIDFDWCCRFSKLVANFTRQRIDATAPLLSAFLSAGERMKTVLRL